MAGPLQRANKPALWLKLLLGLQLSLGLAYAIAELGELPHYHDSNAYFELARTLRVDAHRGIAYPVFLAAADGLAGSLSPSSSQSPSPSPSLLGVIANEHPGAPCTAPAGIALVQLLQLGLCAGALLYWLRTRDATARGTPSPSTLPWAGTLVVA